MDAENLRVLVFTVSAWSEKTGTNTMSSLLSWCKSENLANVYMRTDLPTFTGCDNYFQITENRVIKSILKRSIKTGKQVTVCGQTPDKEYEIEKNRYNKFRQKRPRLLLLAREVLWWLGRWKSPELVRFIDDFAPDVIFFSYEGYLHYNRIVRFAIKHTKAKAVGYIWDDYITYKQTSNFLHSVYRFFQRKSLKKLSRLTNKNFAISPKTKKEADKFFGFDCDILTKAINFEGKEFKPYTPDTPIKMLYTGNLGIGRLDSLKVVSDALDKVNGNEKKITLDVYTNTYIPQETLSVFGDSVTIHGAIPQSEAIQKQTQADILLFIEDIIGKDRKTARLSFSTKLTDYFASGKCIFALADKDIAPMEYLIENDVALASYDFDTVVEKLNFICNNPDAICEYGKRAWDLGQKNHDNKQIIAKLKQTLQSLFD